MCAARYRGAGDGGATAGESQAGARTSVRSPREVALVSCWDGRAGSLEISQHADFVAHTRLPPLAGSVFGQQHLFVTDALCRQTMWGVSAGRSGPTSERVATRLIAAFSTTHTLSPSGSSSSS